MMNVDSILKLHRPKSGPNLSTIIVEAAGTPASAADCPQQRRIIGKGIVYVFVLWTYIKIHTLTTIDILVSQRKPGAPITHIRHLDDWMERHYRQWGGLGVLSNTPGGEWIFGDFWCGGRSFGGLDGLLD